MTTAPEPTKVTRYSGVLSDHHTAKTKAGKPFVAADLILDDGTRLPCRWWNPSKEPAPPKGSRVDVEGKETTWNNRPQLSIQSTRVHDTENLGPLQRLIRYYINAIAAEGAHALQLNPLGKGERFVVLEQGHVAVFHRGDGKGVRIVSRPVPMVRRDRCCEWPAEAFDSSSSGTFSIR